jgi:L-aminopeptidase/D-esterase-like protein
VIPADRKWFARIAVAAVLAKTLIDIDPRYPEVGKEQRRKLVEVKAELEAQAPTGAAPDPFEQGLLKAGAGARDGAGKGAK